eukprot:gene654-949_t
MPEARLPELYDNALQGLFNVPPHLCILMDEETPWPRQDPHELYYPELYYPELYYPELYYL